MKTEKKKKNLNSSSLSGSNMQEKTPKIQLIKLWLDFISDMFDLGKKAANDNKRNG